MNLLLLHNINKNVKVLEKCDPQHEVIAEHFRQQLSCTDAGFSDIRNVCVHGGLPEKGGTHLSEDSNIIRWSRLSPENMRKEVMSKLFCKEEVEGKCSCAMDSQQSQAK